MIWWQRWLIVVGVFALIWWGITEFCIYWCQQEQQRMAGKPMAPGLKHRKVGR